MSKATIIDNDLLKSEIRALNNYVNRDEYNLNVVEVMLIELQDMVKGLKPCEKTDNPVICPKCYSNNVQCMYGTTTVYNYTNNLQTMSSHYMCLDCHKEFDV